LNASTKNHKSTLKYHGNEFIKCGRMKKSVKPLISLRGKLIEGKSSGYVSEMFDAFLIGHNIPVKTSGFMTCRTVYLIATNSTSKMSVAFGPM